MDSRAEIVFVVAGFEVIPHVLHFGAEVGYCFVVILIVHTIDGKVMSSQCKINIRKLRIARIFGGATEVSGGIFLLHREQLRSTLQVGDDILIVVLNGVTCDSRTRSRLIRSQACRYSTIEANEYKIIMRTQEKRLAKALITDGLRKSLGSLHTLNEDIALPNTNPWRAPHIERHTVVRKGSEIGSLYGLKTVISATCSYIRVTSYDIQTP